MITKEFVKKWNGTEIPFKLSWMSQPCNCAVLVDLEKGLSIKPFIIDETEMDIFVNDLMQEMGYNKEFALEDMARPTFCLFFAKEINDDAELMEILETKGGCLELPSITSPNPSCPFA